MTKPWRWRDDGLTRRGGEVHALRASWRGGARSKRFARRGAMGTPSGSLALALLLESQSSIKDRNRGPPRRKACLGGPLFLSCGAMGIRTPDLFHAMEARYQLRHSPVTHSREHSQNVTSSTQQVQLEFTPMRRLLRVTRCVRAPLGRRASQRRAGTRASRVGPMGTLSGSLTLALLLESQSSIKDRNRGPPRRKACLGGPLFLSCGAMGIRTPDLFHAMEARYQLRHSPALSS